jgi:hypothetical protein
MSSKPGVKEYISLKPKVKKGIFRKLKAEQDTPPESEGKTRVLFTKFPNLPDELQVLIWEFAIVGAGPRLVEIITRPLARKQPCQMETEAAENATPKPIWGITSDCPVPLLLLACYMSYEIASKHYQKAFKLGGCQNLRETYFNFERDILYLTEMAFQKHEPSPSLNLKYLNTITDLSKVQNLAILVSEGRSTWHLKKYLYSLLNFFSGIQHLTLVVGCQQNDLEKFYGTPPSESASEIVLYNHDIFENGNWGIEDSTFKLPNKGSPRWCRNMVRSLMEEMNDFQDYKERKDVADGKSYFVIPSIDYKIELRKGLLQKLLDDKAAHDARRATRGPAYRLTAAELHLQNRVSNTRHKIKFSFADSVP